MNINVRKWLAGYILAFTYSAQAVSLAPMIVRYPFGNGTVSPAQQYHYDLIKLVLDETKPDYGDYKIEPYISSDLSATQKAQMISDGTLINLVWNAPGTIIANADVIPVAFDTMHGLLGYRVCITTSANQAVLKNVKDVSSLSQIRVGQYAGWTDVNIYNSNKVTPILSDSFTGLFDMLAANRFDCLALDAIGAKAIYNEQVKKFPTLKIDEHLLIYYDFPFYFYVSHKYPLLAERLTQGLKMLQANGKFEQFYGSRFQKSLDDMNIKKRNWVCLRSPYSSNEHQCEDIEKLKHSDRKGLTPIK